MTLPTLFDQFNKAALQFEEDTAVMSFTDRDYPSFKELVAMGSVICPWALRRMHNAPTHWMTVLHDVIRAHPRTLAILGVPVITKPGHVQSMMEAWRKWGHDNGFL